jgi:hypothetical protein
MNTYQITYDLQWSTAGNETATTQLITIIDATTSANAISQFLRFNATRSESVFVTSVKAI